MIYVDLDGFKPVNDRYGHVVGDRVLAQVAGRIASATHGGLVGRLGGDEFAVVVEVPTGDKRTLERVADAIIAAVRAPVALGGEQAGDEVCIDASAGLAVIRGESPGDDHNPAASDVAAATASALAEADAAMYQAKRAGRGRAHWLA